MWHPDRAGEGPEEGRCSGGGWVTFLEEKKCMGPFITVLRLWSFPHPVTCVFLIGLSISGPSRARNMAGAG